MWTAEAGVAVAAWLGGDGWLDAQGPHMACAMSVADSLATVIVAQCADNGGHRGSGAVMSDPGLVGDGGRYGNDVVVMYG